VDTINTAAAFLKESRILAIGASLRRTRRSNRGLRYIFVLATVCFLTNYPLAQQPHPTESQVKAAYVFNFGKFVSWQGAQVEAQDSFKICILGKNPFGSVLESTVSGEQIGGKKITLERLSKVPDNPICSVLFISSTEEGHLEAILAAARPLNILTVSDMPHFAERGGIIGLVTQQDKVRFEVNRFAAEQSQLTLSSELLKVATRVIERPISGH
jgi:hypothetical protein